jgi:hypothetical protein
MLIAIDFHDYSLIALLAGTEVYVAPEILERYKAVENPEKVRPRPGSPSLTPAELIKPG